jgi:hypothetical protein
MSQAGRLLQVGDYALTDYNGPGPLTRVQIVAESRNREHGHSQSGVLYRVSPLLKPPVKQSLTTAATAAQE